MTMNFNDWWEYGIKNQPQSPTKGSENEFKSLCRSCFEAGEAHGTMLGITKGLEFAARFLDEATRHYPADVFPDDGVDDTTKTRWSGQVMREMLPRLAEQVRHLSDVGVEET